MVIFRRPIGKARSYMEGCSTKEEDCKEEELLNV
jgi:hypothetical protein